LASFEKLEQIEHPSVAGMTEKCAARTAELYEESQNNEGEDENSSDEGNNEVEQEEDSVEEEEVEGNPEEEIVWTLTVSLRVQNCTMYEETRAATAPLGQRSS
jgi:hypothetical protein